MLLNVNGAEGNSLSADFVKPEVYAVTFTSSYVDRYDRRIFSKNGRRFYFYFTTSYKVLNKPTTAENFWRKPLVGKIFQAKVAKEGAFWFVQQINIAN